MTGAKIFKVLPGSIADEIGLSEGDIILKCNGHEIEDELSMRFYFAAEEVELQVICSGELEIIEIENPYLEDLGVEFESALLGNAKSCKNKCIFCFIDQLPKGMRKPLYFKDDDSRLSYLTGNYVTLTNVTDEEIDRIIEMHIEPINISVHTMNPDLRVFMLKNPAAAKLPKQMEKLKNGKIHMNCQIVAVRGINDGENLCETIKGLAKFYPYVTSVSVVPMGMTKFREGLFEATPYDRESSLEILDIVSKWQEKLLSEIGTRFIYAADEFFLNAGKEIPCDEYYEGYYQIENGVGLMRNLEEEFKEALETSPKKYTEVTIITGMAAEGLMRHLAEIAMKRYEGIKIHIKAIRNDFFGEKITVAGLVVGGDIINQLKGEKITERVLIPSVMLKDNTDLFLDDVTVSDIEKALSCKISVSDCTGGDLWKKIIDEVDYE